MAQQLSAVDRRIRWGVVGLVAGTILLASILPAGGVGRTAGPLGVVGLDKWFHTVGYTLLAVAIATAVIERHPRRAGIIVFAGALGFGIGVEVLQLVLPYREFSWLDVLANGIGPLLIAVGWPMLVSDGRLG